MDNVPRIGVGVLVEKDGKFLSGKRLSSHGNNTWSLPGGHLEFFVTPKECAVREVMEETGVHIKNLSLFAVTNDIFRETDKHILLFASRLNMHQVMCVCASQAHLLILTGLIGIKCLKSSFCP